MNILIFMSSALEMQGVLDVFNCKIKDGERIYSISDEKNNIDFCYSDPGIFSLTYFLTGYLKESDYDLVVNAGIAGSFSPDYVSGSMVRVEKDCFADIGVEEEGVFKNLFSMGLIHPDTHPFKDGFLFENAGIYSDILSDIPKVGAVTVNQVSSSTETIKRVVNAYLPEIETMEGAAFFYVCKMEKKNCIQLRAISNTVGERDKRKWNIEGSLSVLGETIKQMINELGTSFNDEL